MNTRKLILATIRKELVCDTINKAYIITDHDAHISKQFEFRQQTILADKFLTEVEKLEAIKIINEDLDYYKVLLNEGTKRICENCQHECLATLYCEFCVRNYLKAKFSNWTSGNDEIDNLVKKCQMETYAPDMIVEWIPYNNLLDVKYLTKGGFSEIYVADWIDGHYNEWDSKKQKLKRFGTQEVILKRLANFESANWSWFKEGQYHLTISNKCGFVVQCYGLTKDPSDGNYMLVMNKMDMDLRRYLQKNNNKLTWKERIQIVDNIIEALSVIHKENAIHRDLHSGNILFSQLNHRFFISDLGFCGPADKPLNSVYGKLPYIAPEVIAGKETTFASDIYSIGMLMWEISSGQPPFINYENDYHLMMNIINGMRPKIVPGTPLEYEKLMKQCWDSDPEKRPDAKHLNNKIGEINRLSHQNENKGLPEPRNATKEEQEAYRSIEYDLTIQLDLNPNISVKSNFANKNDTKKKRSISVARRKGRHSLLEEISQSKYDNRKRLFSQALQDDEAKGSKRLASSTSNVISRFGFNTLVRNTASISSDLANETILPVNINTRKSIGNNISFYNENYNNNKLETPKLDNLNNPYNNLSKNDEIIAVAETSATALEVEAEASSSISQSLLLQHKNTFNNNEIMEDLEPNDKLKVEKVVKTFVNVFAQNQELWKEFKIAVESTSSPVIAPLSKGKEAVHDDITSIKKVKLINDFEIFMGKYANFS